MKMKYISGLKYVVDNAQIRLEEKVCDNLWCTDIRPF